MEPGAQAWAWRYAYARQALSDFDVYDRLCQRVEVDECHRMHYLQMALEKSAKAYFWRTSGARGAPSKINRSHKVAEKILPSVFKAIWRERKGKTRMPGWMMAAARQLCHEVDLLAPAVDDDEQRPDNCEYPWEVLDGDGVVVAVKSPLDQEFAPPRMVNQPGVAGFLKAIRVTVAKIVAEGPPA